MSRFFPLVSIIIPAFNEAESLAELYERTHATLAAIDQPFEFILVDDGSTDDTVAEAQKLAAAHGNVIIIEHVRNLGKSMALMQGFAEATGDVAITMDADLQDQPEQIPDFLKKISDGFDLVNGWREKRKDTIAKRVVSRMFNRITSRFLKCDLHDLNCGFKALRHETYKELNLTSDQHRLIPAIAAAQGFTVTEIPVDHEDRKYGVSKYSLLRYRGVMDIAAITITRAMQVRPFHVFTEISLLFWLMAAASGTVWLLSGKILPTDVPVIRLITPLLGYFSAWCVFVGTILPLMGLFMEIMLSQSDTTERRRKFIRHISGKD